MDVALCSAVAATAFAVAAWRDLTRRQIDNHLWLTAAFAWIAAAALGGGDIWGDIPRHFGVAAAAFGVMLCLYACGWIGGGDVKMAAIVFLWAGPDRAVPTLTLTALIGLALALVMLALRPVRRGFGGHPRVGPVLAMFDDRRGVPYGVALSLAGIAAIASPWLSDLR